jgi:endonuclease/exonuclease/phosphatase family metal-dependent hydrolase
MIGEELGRYNPDILVIQEPGSIAHLYDTLIAAMGNQYRYKLLKCPDYQESNRIGLLVMSDRISVDSTDHCIRGDDPEVEQLFNHWARITLKYKSQPIVIYGFKLAPRDRYEMRRRQIDTLTPYLKKDLAESKYVIVAGDLNHRPFDREYERWLNLGLVDSYDSLAQGSGFTKMDELGEDVLVPYRRIDYLLLNPELASTLSGSSQTLQERFFIPDPPQRPWSLSDHLPVMAIFRFYK